MKKSSIPSIDFSLFLGVPDGTPGVKKHLSAGSIFVGIPDWAVTENSRLSIVELTSREPECDRDSDHGYS